MQNGTHACHAARQLISKNKRECQALGSLVPPKARTHCMCETRVTLVKRQVTALHAFMHVQMYAAYAAVLCVPPLLLQASLLSNPGRCAAASSPPTPSSTWRPRPSSNDAPHPTPHAASGLTAYKAGALWSDDTRRDRPGRGRIKWQCCNTAIDITI